MATRRKQPSSTWQALGTSEGGLGAYVKWIQPIIFAGSIITTGAVGHYRLGIVESQAKLNSERLEILKEAFTAQKVDLVKYNERFEQVERDNANTKLDMKEIRVAIGIIQLQAAKICVKLKCD